MTGFVLGCVAGVFLTLKVQRVWARLGGRKRLPVGQCNVCHLELYHPGEACYGG